MSDGDDILEFGKVTRVTPDASLRVTTLQVAGVGDEGSDGESDRPDEVEFMQPLGIAASPVLSAHTEAAYVRHGDRCVALAVLDKSRVAQAVEAGEVRLYGPGDANATAKVAIPANGRVVIVATAGQNITIDVTGAGDIILNGGTHKVARDADPVNIGAITATAGPYPVVFSTVLQNADGTPGSPTVGATAALSGVISNAGGAPHVKA